MGRGAYCGSLHSLLGRVGVTARVMARARVRVGVFDGVLLMFGCRLLSPMLPHKYIKIESVSRQWFGCLTQYNCQLNMADHIAVSPRFVSFSYDVWGWSSSHWRLMQQKHLFIEVHAFVGSRLDYYNSVFAGIIGQLLQKLQTIQNAAAQLITSTWKLEQITPVLQDLHWLPVRQRIEFKIALLFYKYVHVLAPLYLAAFCQALPDEPGRSRLRSADLYQLHVPPTRTNLGDRSFSVNGPVLWNILPVDLWTPDMLLDTFNGNSKCS